MLFEHIESIPKFNVGDIIVGNEKAKPYHLSQPNTLWVVVGYKDISCDNENLRIDVYKGDDIPPYKKVNKWWDEKYFTVQQDCFDLVTTENERLLHLLKGDV